MMERESREQQRENRFASLDRKVNFLLDIRKQLSQLDETISPDEVEEVLLNFISQAEQTLSPVEKQLLNEYNRAKEFIDEEDPKANRDEERLTAAYERTSVLYENPNIAFIENIKKLVDSLIQKNRKVYALAQEKNQKAAVAKAINENRGINLTEEIIQELKWSAVGVCIVLNPDDYGRFISETSSGEHYPGTPFMAAKKTDGLQETIKHEEEHNLMDGIIEITTYPANELEYENKTLREYIITKDERGLGFSKKRIEDYSPEQMLAKLKNELIAAATGSYKNHKDPYKNETFENITSDISTAGREAGKTSEALEKLSKEWAEEDKELSDLFLQKKQAFEKMFIDAVNGIYDAYIAMERFPDEIDEALIRSVLMLLRPDQYHKSILDYLEHLFGEKVRKACISHRITCHCCGKILTLDFKNIGPMAAFLEEDENSMYPQDKEAVKKALDNHDDMITFEGMNNVEDMREMIRASIRFCEILEIEGLDELREQITIQARHAFFDELVFDNDHLATGWAELPAIAFECDGEEKQVLQEAISDYCNGDLFFNIKQNCEWHLNDLEQWPIWDSLERSGIESSVIEEYKRIIVDKLGSK